MRSPSPVSTACPSLLINNPLISNQEVLADIASNSCLRITSPSDLITTSIKDNFLNISFLVIGISGPPKNIKQSGFISLSLRASA